MAEITPKRGDHPRLGLGETKHMRPLSIRTRVYLRRCVTTACLFSALLSNAGCKAEQWPLWESYANKFVDGQGRVIDHGAQDITTTEGEAYAMFFSLVANDRSRFDKLLDWTETNMAQGDLTEHLPAWSWGKASDGSWHVLDANPASDADLWMAYDLCEAGRLWNIDRYSKLGALMANRIAQSEVVLIPQVGTTLLPGAEGFHPSADTWYLNPSYMPPSILAYFSHHDSTAPWRQVMEILPSVVKTQSGFAMNWMKVTPTGLQPSAAPAAEVDAAKNNKPMPSGVGSYDAIRVYLWLGLADPKTTGVKAALKATSGMADYLQTHPVPPEQVDATGRILSQTPPPGFSAAVVPYLHALGLKQETDQLNHLSATLDPKSGLYGHNGDYYDQNLALFALGWQEHRYSFEVTGTLHVKWK